MEKYYIIVNFPKGFRYKRSLRVKQDIYIYEYGKIDQNDEDELEELQDELDEHDQKLIKAFAVTKKQLKVIKKYKI